MAYQSEADQWRERFEAQKSVCIIQAVQVADLQQWNCKLAEETLRIRETNRELRDLNAMLASAYVGVAYLVIFATIWNVIS